MSENKPIVLKYSEEHKKPVCANNFQLYPVSSEVVIEFNSIDYPTTFKKSSDGNPSDIYVDPVITLQFPRDVAISLFQNLARLLMPKENSDEPAIKQEVKSE